MPAFKEMRGVTLATQVSSQMVAAGQMSTLTKFQRHRFDLIKFLLIDLLNSWLLPTMEKKSAKRSFCVMCCYLPMPIA